MIVDRGWERSAFCSRMVRPRLKLRAADAGTITGFTVMVDGSGRNCQLVMMGHG